MAVIVGLCSQVLNASNGYRYNSEAYIQWQVLVSTYIPAAKCCFAVLGPPDIHTHLPKLWIYSNHNVLSFDQA